MHCNKINNLQKFSLQKLLQKPRLKNKQIFSQEKTAQNHLKNPQNLIYKNFSFPKQAPLFIKTEDN